MYFNQDSLEALSREICTVPVDGEGRTLEVGYTDMFVRGTITKLIADIKSLQQASDKQKEFIATVVNHYHHVLTYDLTQEGVSLVNEPA